MCSLKIFIYLIFTGGGGDRICRIYSPSLTTDGGMMDIPSGTQNVILYCICRRGGTNAAAGPTYWFINGNRVTNTTADGDNPYSRNNVPAPLIIPSFTGTSAGTYGCSENINGQPLRVTINLVAISGMCIYNNFLISYIMILCMFVLTWLCLYLYLKCDMEILCLE